MQREEHVRKRSAAIALVLAGSLAGCSDPEAQRDVYTALDGCRKHWKGPAGALALAGEFSMRQA